MTMYHVISVCGSSNRHTENAHAHAGLSRYFNNLIATYRDCYVSEHCGVENGVVWERHEA